MNTARIVLAALLALAFVLLGLAKITRQEQMVERAHHLGHTEKSYFFIGGLEVLAAAGLVVGVWFPLLGASPLPG